MSERAPRRYTDGTVTFEGGIDAGVMPSEVDKNQVAFAVNANFRQGFVSCRPGFVQKDYDLCVTITADNDQITSCLLYTSPSPRDRQKSRMPSSA